MEEMFNATLITNEPEALVDEETCDSPGRHNRVLRCARETWDNPRRFRTAVGGRMKPEEQAIRRASGAEKLGQCRSARAVSQACPNSLCSCGLRIAGRSAVR
jgi:hypothetical protein